MKHMHRYRNVTMKLFTLDNEKCLGGDVFMEIKRLQQNE